MLRQPRKARIPTSRRGRVVIAAWLTLALGVPFGGPGPSWSPVALAQDAVGGNAKEAPEAEPAASGGVVLPGFWDPRRRPVRPDLGRLKLIRFMTENDYPPFNFPGHDGNPAGFNVDLARMVCEELKVACTMQMRRFDTLLDALVDDRGDAAIASIAATTESRKKADFSDSYYRTPARFVARRELAIDDVRPETLAGRTVAVVGGTAHEAYLTTLFPEIERRVYPNAQAAREALRGGEVELLFDDGITLAFWLNGEESQGCCGFRGGPFFESRYFGAGIGIAVRRGNDGLLQALNFALFRVWEKGRFNDLWLRYFPISPF